MLLGLLASMVLAQDVRAWQGLHEGMLTEAEQGDTVEAISWYEGLIAGLPEDDSSQAELHYWLGRAYYAQGDAQGARRALKVAAESEDPTIELEAKALLGQIDALELQVHRLPVETDFATGTGHFLHSWRHADKGYIRSIVPPGETDPALAWTTEVTEREDDAILLSFAPEAPALSEISFRIRSERFSSELVLLLEDTMGRRYAFPRFIVTATGEWAEIRVLVEDFVLVDNGLTPIDPDRIATLSLWDRTAFETSSRGLNTHYLDDLALR